MKIICNRCGKEKEGTQEELCSNCGKFGMNNRELAMNWWNNKLTEGDRDIVTYQSEYRGRHWSHLTGREIEDIYTKSDNKGNNINP